MRTLYRDFDTQAQIDAQYNPSAGLEPNDQPMLHFAARAAHARASLRCELNVPYGPTLDETLDIDDFGFWRRNDSIGLEYQYKVTESDLPNFRSRTRSGMCLRCGNTT